MGKSSFFPISGRSFFFIHISVLLLFFFFQSAQRYLLKLHIYSGIFSLWNANDWADFLCNINWWYFPFDDESGIGKKNARFYLRICDREKQLNNSNRGRIGHTNRSVQVLGGCCAQVNETKFMFYVGIGEDMFFWEDIYVLQRRSLKNVERFNFSHIIAQSENIFILSATSLIFTLMSWLMIVPKSSQHLYQMELMHDGNFPCASEELHSIVKIRRK